MEDTEAGAGALYAASCITRDNDIRQGEREATRDTYVRSTPHSAAVSRRFLAWLMASHGARPTARHAARTCTAPSARCAPCAPAPVISRHLAHRYLCVCQICVCVISHMVCVCKVHRICAQGISEFVSCVSRGINHHKSVRRTRDQYITGGTGHGRVAWHTHDTRHTHLRDTMPH